MGASAGSIRKARSPLSAAVTKPRSMILPARIRLLLDIVNWPPEMIRERGKYFLAVQALPLLLFRHGAKILNAQDERLATSPKLVTRLHLPHAIVVRLHVCKSNVVILTPETAVTVGV